LNLYHEKSVWLIDGFELKEGKRKIFPVDQFTNEKPYTLEERVSEKKILHELRYQS